MGKRRGRTKGEGSLFSHFKGESSSPFFLFSEVEKDTDNRVEKSK